MKRRSHQVSSNSAAQPAQLLRLPEEWSLCPSHKQIDVPPEKRTHTRPLPLPTTIVVIIDGVQCRGQYAGHGQSKVVYLLDSCGSHKWCGKIFKVCRDDDQEPYLFKQMGESAVYPHIYAISTCMEYNSVEQPVLRWYAWVCEYAKPLDKCIGQDGVTDDVIRRCIAGTIRVMLRAATQGHPLSDNGLYNFGMIQSNVVIIDAGSRIKCDMTKGDFNKTCMRKFWPKLNAFVQQSHFTSFQRTWQSHDTIYDASEAFEALWNDLSNESSSAERSAHAFKECKTYPHVFAVLNDIEATTLDWLVRTFLWDRVAYYGPAAGDTLRKGNVKYTAVEKLENLITETQERRYLSCTHDHVMTETELGNALNAWKECYSTWMHPESLAKAYEDRLPQNKWQQLLRKQFRSHLFDLCGSYELILFCLAAPFTIQNLNLFQQCIERLGTRNEALKEAKKHVRGEA